MPRHRELLRGSFNPVIQPADRSFLWVENSAGRECALALEQQAELSAGIPSDKVGCAGIDTVILSGCSPIFGKRGLSPFFVRGLAADAFWLTAQSGRAAPGNKSGTAKHCCSVSWPNGRKTGLFQFHS